MKDESDRNKIVPWHTCHWRPRKEIRQLNFQQSAEWLNAVKMYAALDSLKHKRNRRV